MVDLRNQEAAAELEKKILQEIGDLERRIRDLQREKETYERMLLKARQQRELVARTDVTRKNSVTRILIESSVIEALRETGRVRGTRSLYRDACLIVGSLKEGTFRTTLHRMKARGLISSVGSGKWQIGEVAVKAAPVVTLKPASP